MAKANITAKITGQKTQTQARCVIKFDPQEMDWKGGDIIRVISKKKENKIILTKVNKKYSKQVAYTLTSTGRGDFEFNQGIFIAHKPTRFSGEFANGKSAEVKIKKEHNRMEIKMPKSVFA